MSKLESMDAITPNLSDDLVNDNSIVEVEPGNSVSCYQNCAVHTEDTLDSGEVDFTVLQSSNAKCVVSSWTQICNVEVNY